MISSAAKEILLVAFWGADSFSGQYYSAHISTQSRIIDKTAWDTRIMATLAKSSALQLASANTSGKRLRNALQGTKVQSLWRVRLIYINLQGRN
jgi:hypothetical protein